MFNKADEKKNGRERNGTPPRVAAGESAISIIGPGMRVQGDITTDGTIRIEGSIRGCIRAGKAVVLGKQGDIVGDIFTQDAVIGGKIVGTLVAESRLELQSTSIVEGEIRARAEHLKLDEGASFNGQIAMINGEEMPVFPPPLEVPSEV